MGERPTLQGSSTSNPPRVESKPEGLKPTQRSSAHWRELDLFRGLAAALMVINHVAVDTPGYDKLALLSASERIGGFAPVLFYFATGLGYGVQSIKPAGHRGWGFLLKVMILLLADSDFFIFIGFSMLVLELIRRFPRGERIAVVLAIAAVATRFVAGPLLRSRLEHQPWGETVGDLLGIGVGLGYSPGPWLAFPMIGFVLGKLAASKREALDRWRWLPLVLLSVAIPFAIGSAGLVARGGDLQRYGSMNAAYFLASFAVLAVSLSVCFLFTRIALMTVMVKVISLSGLRSFAVVPLHYLLLTLATVTMGTAVDSPSFLRNLLPVLLFSFIVSAYFVQGASLLERSANRSVLWLVGLVLTVTYYAVLRHATTGLLETAIRSSYQLMLCLMLSFRVGPERVSRDSPPK